MRWMMMAAAAVALSGCQLELAPLPEPAPRRPQTENVSTASVPAGARPTGSFAAVVASVEPVAERICRDRRPGTNCDFKIFVDTRPGQPPNAYQTLDERGRPIIGFTSALIAEARNADELAFILGHEAAHHIRGHIPRAQQSAVEGALIGGLLATLGGFEGQGIETAQRIGATFGARRYSKDFELQADSLGVVIASRAGYDPVRGAEFFNRIPDPGNGFLATHPPNAERIATVRRRAARL